MFPGAHDRQCYHPRSRPQGNKWVHSHHWHGNWTSILTLRPLKWISHDFFLCFHNMSNARSLIGPWSTNHNEDMTPNLIWLSYRHHKRETRLTTRQEEKEVHIWLFICRFMFMVWFNYKIKTNDNILSYFEDRSELQNTWFKKKCMSITMHLGNDPLRNMWKHFKAKYRATHSNVHVLWTLMLIN